MSHATFTRTHVHVNVCVRTCSYIHGHVLYIFSSSIHVYIPTLYYVLFVDYINCFDTCQCFALAFGVPAVLMVVSLGKGHHCAHVYILTLTTGMFVHSTRAYTNTYTVLFFLMHAHTCYVDVHNTCTL